MLYLSTTDHKDGLVLSMEGTLLLPVSSMWHFTVCRAWEEAQYYK